MDVNANVMQIGKHYFFLMSVVTHISAGIVNIPKQIESERS